MLRNKRHCLQVLEFEPSSTNCKQSKSIQVFESLRKHIVPMQNNLKENTNLVEHYIYVHCATLVRLSNSRMQNPEQNCVAKIQGKSACSRFAVE